MSEIKKYRVILKNRLVHKFDNLLPEKDILDFIENDLNRDPIETMYDCLEKSTMSNSEIYYLDDKVHKSIKGKYSFDSSNKEGMIIILEANDSDFVMFKLAYHDKVVKIEEYTEERRTRYVYLKNYHTKRWTFDENTSNKTIQDVYDNYGPFVDYDENTIITFQKKDVDVLRGVNSAVSTKSYDGDANDITLMFKFMTKSELKVILDHFGSNSAETFEQGSKTWRIVDTSNYKFVKERIEGPIIDFASRIAANTRRAAMSTNILRRKINAGASAYDNIVQIYNFLKDEDRIFLKDDEYQIYDVEPAMLKVCVTLDRFNEIQDYFRKR